MNFSKALNALFEGRKISRRGWNGENQYIELGFYVTFIRPNGEKINADNRYMGTSAIVFWGTNGNQVGWLASQGDLLANDWYIV